MSRKLALEESMDSQLQRFSSLRDSNPEKAKDIINAFNRLQLVQIILESHENPYIIFESINSKGVHLTAGDLIRN